MNPSPQQGRTTLAAVASQAGVSVATVLNVVNYCSDVSASTRARVRHLLEEHGYLPRTSHRQPANTTVALELAFEGDLHAYTAEVLRDGPACRAYRSAPQRRMMRCSMAAATAPALVFTSG